MRTPSDLVIAATGGEHETRSARAPRHGVDTVPMRVEIYVYDFTRTTETVTATTTTTKSA